MKTLFLEGLMDN